MTKSAIRNSLLGALALSACVSAAQAGEVLQRMVDSYTNYQIHPKSSELMKATLSLVLDDETGDLVGLSSRGRVLNKGEWTTVTKRWSLRDLRNGADMLDPIAGVRPVTLKAPQLDARNGGILDIYFVERILPYTEKYVRFELIRGNKGPKADWQLHIVRSGDTQEKVDTVAAYVRFNSLNMATGIERFVINPRFSY